MVSPSQQAAAVLCTVAALHRIPADPDGIVREFEATGSDPDEVAVCRAALRLGLKAKGTRLVPARIPYIPTPAIIRIRERGWATLARVSEEAVLFQVPGSEPEQMSPKELAEVLELRLILLKWRSSLTAAKLKFGLAWFLPTLLKYRSALAQILLASFVLQLMALGSPMLFQVIMDKVLPHNSITTLNVIAIALIGIAIFEGAIGWLRSYLTSHTASRLDVELGSSLYQHLLGLPLAYFQTRPAGQTVARIRELDSIREFLTGAALTVALDVLFGVVAFGILVFYSVILSCVVAISVVLYFLISFFAGPVLRKQVEQLFERAAVNQSFLVESVTGAETVKAMAIEPLMRHFWEGNLAGYVAQGFRLAMTGASGVAAITFVSKLTNVAILWVGVGLVHKGDMTIGELIAFNMIAGQMSSPVLRLAQLWQQFQQLSVSIERLADILNTPVEPGADARRPALPEIRGHIRFERVSFRYGPETPMVLQDLSLHIEAGTVVGVVGRSGSGKSTIAKLVQRLYVPGTGRILIDGYDLALADPAWLRRQIGVVLQDNFLFNRSVRDNIAIANPVIPMERVIEAAQLAGAHEFILELPHAYDTVLEERGANLSGGQRQRIAIARALATNPRILILDEATSALDYESEAIFQENLQRIVRNRTVIVIAHRLSTVQRADRIVSMEKGRIVEDGAPSELIHSGGLFAQLHQLQSRL